MTIQSCDFNQKNIAAFLSWFVSERNNVATTVNHRLSDIRGFCRYLLKKKAITPDEYEEIREISDVNDDRIIAEISLLAFIFIPLSFLRPPVENKYIFIPECLCFTLFKKGKQKNSRFSLCLKLFLYE